MRVVIIEDEEPAVIKLKRLLKETGEPVDVLASLESVSQAAEWFSTHPEPDLIFMDIRLADGLSFELFNLVSIQSPVIFTTAYNEYAIKAFKVNSIDYLLKPIEPADLDAAIAKYKTLFGNSGKLPKELQQDIQKLLSQFTEKYKTRFFVKVGQRYKPVPVHEIECFYVQGKSTFLLYGDGKSIDIDYSLDQLGSILDPDLFFRVNRNFLINMNSVKEVVIYSGSRLKLKLNRGNYPEDIIVSRDKVSQFKKWMDR